MAEDGFILLYHAMFDRVPEALTTDPHNVTPDAMAEQLGWLKQSYDILALDGWLALADPRGKVALTFDDGYRSALESAPAVLRAHDVTATFFLNGAMLEGAAFWRHKIRYIIDAGLAPRFSAWMPADAPEWPYLLPRDLLFTSKQPTAVNSLRMIQHIDGFLASEGIALQSWCATAGELPDSRHLTYGSHGYHHAVMSSLGEAGARADIRRNRQVLDGLRLAEAQRTATFAMPFGDPQSYTPTILRILAEEGHPSVLLTGPPPDHAAPGERQAIPVRLAGRLNAPATLDGLQAELRRAEQRRIAAATPRPRTIAAATLPTLEPGALAAWLAAGLRYFPDRPILLGLDPLAGAAVSLGAWREIADLAGLRDYIGGVRCLLLTSEAEAADICAELPALRTGIDESRPFFMFLVRRRPPPLYRVRGDGAVSSFLCRADVLAKLLALPETRLRDLSCFGAARRLIALQASLPQILVRQYPAPAPLPAAVSRAVAGPIAVTIPHRGPLEYLVSSLRSLEGTRGVELAVTVVFDEPIERQHHALVALFPTVSFRALSPPGSGYAVTRQILLHHLPNPLIAHLDSDDLATTDRLPRLLAALDGSDTEVVGSHELRVDEIAGTVLACRYPLDVNAGLRSGPDHVQLLGSAVMRRQSVIAAGGFSTALTFSADTQFIYRAFLLGCRMANVDEFLYVRRRWQGALTASAEVGWTTEARQNLEAGFRRDFMLVGDGRRRLRESTLWPAASPREFRLTDLRSYAQLRVSFGDRPRANKGEAVPS